MRIIRVGVLALSPLIGGADLPQPVPVPVPTHLGTMALFSADGSKHEDYAVSSFTLSLQPAQAAEAQDPASLRSMVTSLADIGAIDPFMLAWVTDGHARRHVVFTFGSAPGAGNLARPVVYDLDASEVTSFEAGYSDGGGGQVSLAIAARHMMLDGNRLF